MAKNEDEQYLDYLRYQEVPRETATPKDTKWLNGKAAQRDLKKHRAQQAKQAKRNQNGS